MKKQHLEITDLPRDSKNVFGGIRMPLVRIFNECRHYPAKMTMFKNLLKFMYNTVVAWEKSQVQSVEPKAKTAETAK